MPERFKVVCIPCKALYKRSALPFTFTGLEYFRDIDMNNIHDVYGQGGRHSLTCIKD